MGSPTHRLTNRPTMTRCETDTHKYQSITRLSLGKPICFYELLSSKNQKYNIYIFINTYMKITKHIKCTYCCKR